MNFRFRTLYMEEEGGSGTGGGAAAQAQAAASAATPAPVSVQPQVQVPGTGQPGIPWLASETPAETIGFVQNKAWKTAAEAVDAYRNLEKLLGADRAGRTVTVPTEEADAAGWEQVYNRLGRPPNAEAYQLAVPQGQDPAFARSAAAEFHKLGLNVKQAQALANWWNQQSATMAEGESLKQQQALEAEHKALEKDWGTGPDATARREIARRAAVALGLDEPSMDALEKVTGYSKVLKALAKVGDMMREHGAAGMDGTNVGSFGMTPEGAKSRKQQLMADTEWRKKAMDPKSSEWAELRRLDTIISNAMQAA